MGVAYGAKVAGKEALVKSRRGLLYVVDMVGIPIYSTCTKDSGIKLHCFFSHVDTPKFPIYRDFPKYIEIVKFNIFFIERH